MLTGRYAPLPIFSICNLQAETLGIMTRVFGVAALAGLGVMGGAVWLGRRFLRSRRREYTPERHRAKDMTPSMGGVFFLGALAMSTWGVGLMQDVMVRMATLTTLFFCGVGAYDDACKILSTSGISVRHKWYLQLLGACSFAVAWYLWGGVASVTIPCWGVEIPLGPCAIAWWALIIMAATNAVNLTDGVDGLAGGVTIPVVTWYAFVALSAGPAYAPLAVWCSTAVGVLVAFWLYNRHPAHIFMGDAGSLGIGAILASLAIMTRSELLLPIVGIVFVVETLSVMLQVAWYKRYRQRIFLMAPLHHHFELRGWSENAIVCAAVMITVIACGVATMLRCVC